MDLNNKALPAAGSTTSFVLVLHHSFSSSLSRKTKSIPHQFAPCPDCTVSSEIAGGGAEEARAGG